MFAEARTLQTHSLYWQIGMSLLAKLTELEDQYTAYVVDLDPWHDQPGYQQELWLNKQLMSVYKPEYQLNERIVCTMTRGDVYRDTSTAGQLISNLHRQLNTIDISNFFVILLTNDSKFTPDACTWAQHNISTDPMPIRVITYADEISTQTTETQMKKNYNYNSKTPIKINLEDLSTSKQDLLTTSSSFCMYPWIHLHAYPTGQAYPCCMADMQYPVGNCRTSTLEQVWNDAPMRDIRQRMLSNHSVDACTKCYEQESNGFFSGRQSANKHHGHLVDRVDLTRPDGHLDQFELTYWDIRFSNLCNLSCRSCGHIFSSSWYQDQTQLAGPDWAKHNTVLNYAGRTETDIWEQLVPHLDYVEQIYFAGGEPLIMKEHYNILDELERRGRFDVRLIYNTNFTHVKLKDRTVFEYWKRFDSVAVGASLDAMGPRAEYIRKGTVWDTVERNREQMLDICPDVDFYISPTLSIMNALHLPDFHRAWVEKGLIRAQDLNINILQDPAHYRIDIATPKYKQQLIERYQDHLAWLRPQDPLQRATVGFESAIKFLMTTDNTILIPKFWAKTQELDTIRNECIMDVIPELGALQ
jgi:MoaA/NifB/PqqE/SkfB family radical SAM enzyme